MAILSSLLLHGCRFIHTSLYFVTDSFVLIPCVIDGILFIDRRRLDFLNYARKLVQGELTEEDLDDPLEAAAEVYYLIYNVQEVYCLLAVICYILCRNASYRFVVLHCCTGLHNIVLPLLCLICLILSAIEHALQQIRFITKHRLRSIKGHMYKDLQRCLV